MESLTVESQRITFDYKPSSKEYKNLSETIIFIHGVGADKSLWTEWLPHFQKEYSTVCLNLPGHGSSDPWIKKSSLNFNFYVKLIREVMKKVGKRKVVLIGESMGGTIALAFATEFPDAVLSIVTCSTAHRGGNLQHVDKWRKNMRKIGFEKWSLDMVEKRFMPKMVSQTFYDWFHQKQCASDESTILSMAELLVSSDLTDRLCYVKAPVLLIHPDSSPFIPLEISIELKNLLSHCCIKVIPFARHGIALSHATECATNVLEFFRYNEI